MEPLVFGRAIVDVLVYPKALAESEAERGMSFGGRGGGAIACCEPFAPCCVLLELG